MSEFDTSCWAFFAENVKLPTGIRHLGETSSLQPGMPKMERETLWHIAHALSVLLLKDFNAGVASYAASGTCK